MSVHINLLDWRSKLRDERKREFGVMTGGAFGIGGVLVLMAILNVNGQINTQNERNTLLQQQIVEMDQKTKEIQDLEKTKANLLARMRVIEELQQSRAASVHFFDEIVNTLPEGVYLTSLKQSGADVEIQGVAESNGRVSTYMKNLESSEWFANPKLVVIKTSEKNKSRTSEFTLKVKNLTKPQTGAGTEEEG